MKINFSGKFNIHILRTQTSISGLKSIPVWQASSCAITKTKCDWSNYCQKAMRFVKMINKIKTKGQYFQVNLKPNWLLFYLLTKLDTRLGTKTLKNWKKTFSFIYITVRFLFLCFAHSRKFITRNSVTFPNRIIKFCEFLTSQNLTQLKYILIREMTRSFILFTLFISYKLNISSYIIRRIGHHQELDTEIRKY